MPDRESRKKIITAKRQAQIIKAATEVFSSKGFAAATIPEIAGAAGVAPGTIYIYYPSKRDLFVAVIEGMVVSPLIDIFEREPKREFLVALEEALNDRLRFLTQISSFIPLVGEIQRDPELKTLYVERLVHPLFSRMEGVYRAHIKSGEIRRIEPAILVRLIGGMIIGIGILKSLEGDAGPLNRLPLDRITDEIKNLILYGVLKENNINRAGKG